ncbi:peptide deformylase [Patescibacteria group bacterium]|nr:peptide deformylase [Patescibacteria group bacterium]
MKIITIPHSTLRQVAQPVTTVDKKLLSFIEELGNTLLKKDNPKGVGLAAPQVNEAQRLFATLLPLSGKRGDGEPVLRVFINPVFTDVSEELTFGENPEEPILEGCLSIPEIYGPVPRHQWVEVAYEELVGTELRPGKERFEAYAARVMQHEYDHLDGRLFIDYSAELDLPLYKERGKKMDEMSSDMVKAFYHQSLTK